MKLKIAAGFVLATALIVYAQPFGRGGRGGSGNEAKTPPADAVKTYLSLTDSQLSGFQAIRQTARTAAQPINEQLRTKSQALGTAMNATPVDSAAIASLRTEINALRTQLQKIQTDAAAQMKALLNPEQQSKLATLEAAASLREEIQGAARIGLLEDGGPGGPGFPGGPGGRGKGKGGPKGF